MGTWATKEDVLTLTGVAVNDSIVAQAQGVIDLHSGVPELPESDLRPRDRRLLRHAVAYQAAFIASQPGLFGRAGVDSLNQDGISFNATSNNQGQSAAEVLTLAPLAGLAVRRLSWQRSRSARVRPQGGRGSIRTFERDFLTDRNSDGWHRR